MGEGGVWIWTAMSKYSKHRLYGFLTTLKDALMLDPLIAITLYLLAAVTIGAILLRLLP
jgi:hypothetical protein